MNNLSKENLIDIISEIKSRLLIRSKQDFTSYKDYPEAFNNFYITDSNFLNILTKQKMSKNNILEYRMYFFVPYNLSEIQKGIQAGHTALEYASKFMLNENYQSFIKNDKTWIILNGGTTNSTRDDNGISQGSLNRIVDDLTNMNIDISIFQEPDLENAITAVCFLADERVYNYEKYPDYVDIINHTDGEFHYSDWVSLIGGTKNMFLRNLIKNKKLA